MKRRVYRKRDGNVCAGKPRYEAGYFEICWDTEVPIDTKILADPNLAPISTHH
jgi:hypothetical protein